MMGRTEKLPIHVYRQCFISLIFASICLILATLGFLDDSIGRTYLLEACSMTSPTSITPLQVHERNYTNASDDSVFIFSAFKRCHHSKTLLVNVWENRLRQQKELYSCCFLLPNASVRKSDVTRRVWLNYATSIVNGAMLQCRVPDLCDNYAVTIIHSPPVWKRVQNASSVCPLSMESYVFPANSIVPETYGDLKEANLRKIDQTCLPAAKRNSILDANEPFSFAICAKLAFGKLGGHLLIEWFEYNLKMGVSKILLYTYNLNGKTRRILQHYESKGKLVMLPYDYPLRGSVKRELEEKNHQVWSDEQVVLYDCYERLRLYKYVAVIDFDEFIVPTKDENFKSLMTRLQMLSPKASEFTFKIRFHITNWTDNVSEGARDILALRYQQNTWHGFTLQKTVTIPGRMQFGAMHTHQDSNKLKPFKMYLVTKEVAAISHFRSCYQLFKDDICFSKTKKNTSTIHRHFDEKLKETILKQKQQLLGG